MHIVIFFTFAFLMFERSSGQMPNVFDFCSNVMTCVSNTQNECSLQCKGAPGKRGPPGVGTKGSKGDQGIDGNCDDMRKKIERLEAVHFDCTLGMKNHIIKDSQITTTSDWDSRHAGKYVRIDEQPSGSHSIGAWCSQENSVNEWIQIDFLRPQKVIGIITQGRSVYTPAEWIKTFKLSCGNTVAGLQTVSENGRDKIFTGNIDRTTKVYNWFPVPLTCRFLRFHPLTWNTHICMRMEIMGGDCP